MEKTRKSLVWAVILSESMHIFCCGIPTVVSIASLLVGLGVTSILPAPLMVFHEFMHEWELPMIGFSAAILVIGWVAYIYARRIDCHNTGCCHEPCKPRKDKALIVLGVATALFIVNTLLYVLFHMNGVPVAEIPHPHHDH